MNTYLAINRNDVDYIKKLLDDGVNDDNSIIMRYAIAIGSIKIVSLLIDRGADVNAKGALIKCFDGEPPILIPDINMTAYPILYTAVSNNRLDIIKLLVNHGADIHIDDDIIIMAAAGNSKYSTVKFLLQHGANATAHSHTPIHLAFVRNNDRMIRLFVEHGSWYKLLDPYKYLRWLDERHVKMIDSEEIIRAIKSRRRTEWSMKLSDVIIIH